MKKEKEQEKSEQVSRRFPRKKPEQEKYMIKESDDRQSL